jgi:hypothetical protein
MNRRPVKWPEFNAKAQRRKGAKREDLFFASLRLCAFALNLFSGARHQRGTT